MWSRFGITVPNRIFQNGSLLAFNDLKAEFHLPNRMFFKHFQLRHAVRAQFPTAITLTSNSADHFLISKNVDRICSSLYLQIPGKKTTKITQLCHTRQSDIPSLTVEDRGEDMQQFIPMMISARDTVGSFN